MTSPTSNTRRAARVSRWVTTGLTAAVAVGSVAAMADAAEKAEVDATGGTFGAVARYRGEVAAARMMAAADPGDEGDIVAGDTTAATVLPPRLGSAGVS
jgi:hypothetical protein